MGSLFPKPHTIKRKTGSWVSGRWVSNGETEILIYGSVQPMTGAQAKALPVGRENVGKIQIFCGTQLQIAIEGGDNPGDFIEWEGFKWELIWHQVYNNDILNHTYYVAEMRGPL